MRFRHPDGLAIHENVPLSRYTRFAVGGPARILVDAATEAAIAEALHDIRESGEPYTVMGGGTNLVVSDQGYGGCVLRYTNAELEIDGPTVRVGAGAMLQDLVDATIAGGLKGLETMTGIPGWVGGAIYGNAGAYGHSIHERVVSICFFDADREVVRELDNAACEFAYRESIFKRQKTGSSSRPALQLEAADAEQLRAAASGILEIRNQKYPPTMRCAGSIFKNLMWADLPASVQALVPAGVVREGKVPSA